jgi:hypothetical protein
MAITLNDNIDTAASKPTDNRFGPYTSTGVAIANIPEYQRYVGLTVGVGTPIVEYWFDSTLTLVLKTTSGTVTGITAGTGINIGGTAEAPIISVTSPTQLTTNISTDVIADQLSDTKYPSVKATKTYVDANVVGLLDDRGNFPATSGDYPQPPRGSGPLGAIRKGDLWFISAPGTLGTNAVGIGASVRALVDDATALNDSEWDILDTGLGFIPENVANKVTSGSSITAAPTSETLYPSLNALTEYLSTVIPTTPTLQQVTDAGSTTTNSILIQDTINNSNIYLDNTSQSIIIADLYNATTYGNGNIVYSDGSIIQHLIFPLYGSFSAYIPVSVNGLFANSLGNITIPVGTVTGSGTTNYISKWSSSSALTDSLIFDNGVSVGIGTSTPDAAILLQVEGIVASSTTKTYPASAVVSSAVGSTQSSVKYNFGGNATIPNSIVTSSQLNISTIEFTGPGTVTQDQASGVRAMTNAFLQWGFAGTNNGTVTHVANLRLSSPYSASPSVLTIGNYYGLLIESSDQFPPFSITNKYGIYQYGANDINYFEGNISIGTDTPTSSAKFQIDSTNQGFLPPRMTQTERLAIGSPAEGLIVYDTTNSALGVYSGGGWRKLSMEAF